MTTLFTSRLLLAAFAIISLAACSTTNTAGSTGQFQAKSNWTSSFLSQVLGGQTMPDGVNNWACRPANNQNPVVLIHGTFSSSMYSFLRISFCSLQLLET